MLFAGNAKQCLELIKEELERKDKQLLSLLEENNRLRDEAYKDNELAAMHEELEKMDDKLNEMYRNCARGFPITEKENAAIKEWVAKHEEEVHGIKTIEDKMMHHGCGGGSYSYHFVPTSIGVSGTIRCRCGEEFEFQEIG